MKFDEELDRQDRGRDDTRDHIILRPFDIQLQEVDVLLGPTSPTPAFTLGERTTDPLAMYLSDIYTITGSLAGIPCNGAVLE